MVWGRVGQKRGRQATFETAVKNNATMQGREYIHNLAESRRIGKAGEKAVNDFMRQFVCICADTQLAAPDLGAFLDLVAHENACKVDEIPVLVYWNLNTVGSSKKDEQEGWKAVADAFKQQICMRPAVSMGIVVHKKAVSHMTRRAFHNAVATYLEKAGLDMDIDVSLISAGMATTRKASLTMPGWPSFVAGPWRHTPGELRNCCLGTCRGSSTSRLRTCWHRLRRPLVPMMAGLVVQSFL